MADKLIFEIPTLKREKEAKEFVQEFKKAKSKMNGTGWLDNSKNYSKWVKERKNFREGKNISKDKVPSTTYFVIRKKDNKIIGMVDIRHRLNKFLKETYSGHIGYCVRPSERKKGYGTRILEMALIKAKKKSIKKVLLGCYADNIPSKKIILKCGGKIVGKKKKKGKVSLGFEINIGENKK